MKSLSKLLKKKFPPQIEAKAESKIKSLQLKMLRIQQGIWHSRRRAILVFEGFDAAGKGGAIRRLTEALDPRGFRVHSIGPPEPVEQKKHYLYRFWKDLPAPGTIAIFDRSWYGRVLVERVEELTSKKRWKEAYGEINSFEEMLVADGIDLIKLFFAIHPDEQLRRFEDRLRDPYKQWKLKEEDLEAHAKWQDYVLAADEMLERTNKKHARWHLIPADDKPFARLRALEIATGELAHHGEWMDSLAQKRSAHELKASLKKLEKARKKWKKD